MPLKDIFLGQKNYEVLTICQVLIFTTNIKYAIIIFILQMKKTKADSSNLPKVPQL